MFNRKHVALSEAQRKLSELDAVLVGGRKVQADLAGITKNPDAYLPPSPDLDILLSPKNFKKLEDYLGETPIRQQLFDRQRIHYSTRGAEQEIRLSPFPIYKFSVFPNTDFFVEMVGPIPVTADTYEGGRTTFRLDGSEIKTAKMDFIMATFLNPPAFTPERLKRAMVLLINEANQIGLEAFRKELIPKGMSKLALGQHEVESIVSLLRDNKINGYTQDILHILRRDEYTKYQEVITKKIPNIMRNERKKILNIARHMGIGGMPENDMAYGTVVEAFAKYPRC
ncbi:MAG: hypothetical protein KGH98_02530 [Candidatus Micrarchaeota archaeon]|nr:hypothetical protein [Candidatus Micrarchaeota archaeon]